MGSVAAIPTLASAAAHLTHHHVLRAGGGLPVFGAGITWVWAANGIFKVGHDGQRTVGVQTARVTTPGLLQLLPFVQWAAVPGRLAGLLLAPLLEAARAAVELRAELVTPIEKQFFYVHRDGVRLVAPRDQAGTAGSLRYTMPAGVVLADIHSHHELPAFFSATDDRDDTGLGVAVVIGHIFTRPTIAVRLTCYGARQRVPALSVFDDLGPFTDALEDRDAAPDR